MIHAGAHMGRYVIYNDRDPVITIEDQMEAVCLAFLILSAIVEEEGDWVVIENDEGDALEMERGRALTIVAEMLARFAWPH